MQSTPDAGTLPAGPDTDLAERLPTAPDDADTSPESSAGTTPWLPDLSPPSEPTVDASTIDPRLARIFNYHHLAHIETIQRGLTHALIAGRVLLTVRDRLRRDREWLRWIDTHCKCSRKQAQNYVRLAEGFPEWTQFAVESSAQPDAQRVAPFDGISMRRALAMLAESNPKTRRPRTTTIGPPLGREVAFRCTCPECGHTWTSVSRLPRKGFVGIARPKSAPTADAPAVPVAADRETS